MTVHFATEGTEKIPETRSIHILSIAEPQHRTDCLRSEPAERAQIVLCIFVCAHANFLIRCEFRCWQSKTQCSVHGTIDAARRDLALHKTIFVGGIKF